MKAKDYLLQIEAFQVKIEHKKQRASELRELALSNGAIDYSKERVQSSPDGGKLENGVIKYIELEKEITDNLYMLQLRKDRITNEIHELTNADHIKLLYKRYVECKRLEVIAVEMNFTYQYIRELHGKALQEFQKLKLPTQTDKTMC